MSLLGKILAVLNVVAAVAFVVVAGLDWGQRHRWEYAVFRHDLLVDGLPIDKDEKDPTDQAPRVNKLSDETLTGIFKSAGGKPIKTQVEEVQALRDSVRAYVGNAEVANEQGQKLTRGQKLARYLHALARTYNERQYYAELMANPQVPEQQADQLQQQLDREFDGVSAGANRTTEERKANAARLLYCLGPALEDPKADPKVELPTTPAYKRFVVVAGLTGAARAIDDQALVLSEMTRQAVSAIEADRNAFIAAADLTIYQLQDLADAVQQQEQILATRKAEADKQAALVEATTAKIGDLTKELAALRQDTRTKLDKQVAVEEDIMKRLIELRDTSKKNQELERQIRELEGLPAER
jgi:hypothetical protein